ncbi:MAG: cytochrome c1 [Hyphomicrobiales bacterium]
MIARRLTIVALLSLGIIGSWPVVVASAEETLEAENIPFSFEGAFGLFDRAQLQRGFQVYSQVCSSCHSLNLLHYRNLGDRGGPDFPEMQVKAIAAMVEVEDGPNDEGEMFTRPGAPSDPFVKPFPNEKAARAANGGALPPDLSLITKAREGWRGTFRQLVDGIGGPEYVHAVLTGYREKPENVPEGPAGKYYNPYFSAGPWISMPPPLSDGLVEYTDGTASSVDQMARDVAAFLAWAGEPKMERRKSLGFRVLVYIVILATLLFLTKNRVWSRIEH